MLSGRGKWGQVFNRGVPAGWQPCSWPRQLRVGRLAAAALACIFGVITTTPAHDLEENMRQTSRYATALIIPLLLLPAGARTVAAAGGKRTAVAPASRLSPADELRLNAAIVQHRSVRLQLPPEHQALLGQLTANVKKQLFAMRRPDLIASATQIVSRAIPGLNRAEAIALAEYALDGIAAGDPIASAAASDSSQSDLLNATKQMQETQMSFNLQYLQLQSQMQNENRSYTMISNVMKTKHDTVKNSISNIR
jgi:hypothetical protein